MTKKKMEQTADLVGAVLELALVLGVVEMAARFGDETVFAEKPFFEAADVNALPGAAGTGVSARERPVKLDAVAGFAEALGADVHIGECGHEGLSLACDCGAALRTRAAVDVQPAVRGVEVGNV